MKRVIDFMLELRSRIDWRALATTSLIQFVLAIGIALLSDDIKGNLLWYTIGLLVFNVGLVVYNAVEIAFEYFKCGGEK